MNQSQPNRGNRAQDAVPFDEMFSSQSQSAQSLAGEYIGQTQQIAVEILPALKELRDIVVDGSWTELIPKTQMFYFAVKQIVDGHSEKLYYALGVEVEMFQKLVLDKAQIWGGMTCYPDVLRAREQLSQMQKRFPPLNRIYELVDFSNRQQ